MDHQQPVTDASINTSINGSIEGFFVRSELSSQDQADCYNLIRLLYPNKLVSPASCQGYCSLTLLAGSDTVVQFRPPSYRLDLRTAIAAREVYGRFAPETRYITTLQTSNLLVYGMERIDGISFKDFRETAEFNAHATAYRARLCKDFAALLAESWKRGTNVDLPLGRVGSSLASRLQSVCSDLPVPFQGTAKHILRNLHHIEALPWVLTHGDIVAGNFMVDPSSGKLTGLVDWAEAERLPFGMCLYGLEEILGQTTPTGFQYCDEAEQLREIFWAELRHHIPKLGQRRVLETVKLSRDLGVLLWHGIAFDNGAIDRVVQEGRDKDELYRLEAFLPPSEDATTECHSKI